MKNKYVYFFVVFLVTVSLIFVFTSNDAEARRGCCSHHGGVCGHACCDGSPLSSKCGGGGYITIANLPLGASCSNSKECSNSLICVDYGCQESPTGEKRLSNIGEKCTKQNECDGYNWNVLCRENICTKIRHKQEYESCTFDEECGYTFKCKNNECRDENLRFKGEECDYLYKCDDGLACVNSKCRTPKELGEKCKSNAECSSTFEQRVSCVLGTCMRVHHKEKNETCDYDMQCKYGLTCKKNRCLDEYASFDGERCSFLYWCSDGVCIQGVCRSSYCGDHSCGEDETCSNCASDCGCGADEYCNSGVCKQKCGNGICEKGEMCSEDSCCAGLLVDMKKDDNHCGWCHVVCPSGTSCIDSACTWNPAPNPIEHSTPTAHSTTKRTSDQSLFDIIRKVLSLFNF
ncbi:MAG: hypothetical protein KAI53_02935 [Candidatus Aenigmarchaeota archaeon]|nr:hypothetical protein [Candidatus Aenigmarchaeota archaeon]